MNQHPEEKPICRLCLCKDASSIGSHIFNLSLVKNAVNAIGETRRDKELIFQLNPAHGAKPYFGRNLSVSKIEQVLGRPMTEEERELNINPLVRKYLLCIDCEARVERVEAYFMDNVYVGLHAGAFPIILSEPDLDVVSCDGINEKLVRLYFYSLTWRAAETNYDDFEMKNRHKEHLRRMLNKNLDKDIAIAAKNAATNEEIVNGLNLKILFLTTVDNTTENVINLGLSPEPYFFILNDISFQLFFKPKRVTEHYFWQWGLCKFKRVAELINFKAGPIKIGVVSDAFRKTTLTNLYRRIMLDMLNPCFEAISIGYQKIFGTKPDISLKKEILDEFINVEGVPKEGVGVLMTTERLMLIGAKKIASLLRAAGVPIKD